MSVILTNNSPITAVYELLEMQRYVTENWDMEWDDVTDKLVMEELLKMKKISVQCCHTSSAHISTVSFERTPEDICLISTAFGSLERTYTSEPVKKIPARKNNVTARVVSFVMWLCDQSKIMLSKNSGSGVLILTNIMSTLQATMCGIIFQLFSTYYSWNTSVSLHMVVETETAKKLEDYVGNLTEVHIIRSNELVQSVQKLVHSTKDTSNVSILTTDLECFKSCERMSKGNVSVNMVMDVVGYQNVLWCTELAKSFKYVLHPVPLTDPKVVTYMISTAVTNIDTVHPLVLCRDHMSNILGHWRYVNNMIRHMSIDDKCFDCWISGMISEAMIPLMSKNAAQILEEISNGTKKSWGDLKEFVLEVEVDGEDPEVV